jgi:hypothetical protein
MRGGRASKGRVGRTETPDPLRRSCLRSSRCDRAMFPEVSIRLVGFEGAADVELPIGPADYFVKLPDGLYRLGITNGDCIMQHAHAQLLDRV